MPKIAMSSEVKLMPGIVDPTLMRDEQPVQCVIDELESLLANAKSGRLQAFAIAVVYSGSMVSYCWANSDGQLQHEMTAAIGDLHFDWSLARHRDRHMCRSEDEPA